MPRGSKVFKAPEVPESNASNYPAPFREAQRKRFVRRLSDHAGLKNYGVNYVRVAPGGQSSARHAHKKQDEFLINTVLPNGKDLELRARVLSIKKSESPGKLFLGMCFTDLTDIATRELGFFLMPA